MTRIFHSEVESDGTRKISGAHSCSWPIQKGHSDWLLELGLGLDFDLKSDGRRDLAGENITQRLFTVSFLSSGLRFGPSILSDELFKHLCSCVVRCKF